LSNYRAASNAALMPAVVGGGAVVPVVRWGWLSSTIVVASLRPLYRRDRSTLELEEVSPSISLSRREGWEEAAIEWTLTMVMKLKTKNDEMNSLFPGAQSIEVVLRHFHRHCCRATRCDSLFGKGFRLLVVS
jgi:hypothetical protein